MRSNYKRLGDYIEEVDVRNDGLKVNTLLGLTINKQFIPSVANIIGTDMEKYKIIRRNQFACSTMQVRRDGKMPVALLKDFDEAIISQAYPVFKVKDEKELLPDYLMMWFSRSEFDREACFHAVGGVRGSLEWEDFMNMQLPIPTIEKQREIVAEYNAIKRRINLNSQLIKKLEETAQAVYKQWFVDFEFPDENGKTYKSNGGEMVESELGEIPKGWRFIKIKEVVNILGGGTPSTEIDNYWKDGNILWYSPTDLTKSAKIFTDDTEKKITRLGLENSSAKLFPAGCLLMTSRATIGKLTINQKEACTNQGFIVLIPKNSISVYFLYEWIKTKIDVIQSLSSGSTFLEISKSDFKELDILLADEKITKDYIIYINPIFSHINYSEKEIDCLKNLNDIILSKLSTI